MNKLIFLLILLPNLSFGQSTELYERTIENIKTSEEFTEFAEGRTTQLQVMPEVIPFWSIGFGFFDQLLKYTGTNYSNNNKGEIVERHELSNLSDKKKSKLKIYFSPIENDVVMAELAYASSKNYYYNGITNFGQSLVFLAKYQDGQLVELIATERHNN